MYRLRNPRLHGRSSHTAVGAKVLFAPHWARCRAALPLQTGTNPLDGAVRRAPAKARFLGARLQALLPPSFLCCFRFKSLTALMMPCLDVAPPGPAAPVILMLFPIQELDSSYDALP